jgi:hypothetical protein
MRGSLFGLLVLAVVLTLVLGGAGTRAYAQESTQTHAVENESIVVDYNTTYQLGEKQVPPVSIDGVEVFNKSGAALNDSEFSVSNTTLNISNTSSTADNESATVSYTEQYRSGITRGLKSTLSLVAPLLGLLMLLASGGVLLKMILGGGGY